MKQVCAPDNVYCLVNKAWAFIHANQITAIAAVFIAVVICYTIASNKES